MSPSIQFGVQLPMWDFHVYDEVSFEQLSLMTREAERLRYEYVAIDDHLQRGQDGRCLESLATTAALAAQTNRIRFLVKVLSVMSRHPSLVAKTAVTIDQASNDRLELGMGAGWKEEEATAYGIPWDNARVRLDRLEEACQVILALWTRERVTFRGKYYNLDGAVCNPRSVQRPHLPLWIGGGGERRTLHIAARYADGVSFAGAGIGGGPKLGPVEHFVHKREVFYRHCRDIGRDPSKVKLTVNLNIMLWGRSREAVEARLKREASKGDLSAAEFQRLNSSLEGSIESTQRAVSLIETYIREGATHFIVGLPTLEGMEGFAREVIPKFR